MGPWVYALLGAAVVAVLVACALALRAARSRRTELRQQLDLAKADVQGLGERLDALTAEVAAARASAEHEARAVQPFVITGLVAEPTATPFPREAQLVRAIEVGSPTWIPARPLRETLIRGVSLAHGVRRALSPEVRDRIVTEMRAEVRRSRRQRKAEVKAVRKYLRDRRRSAA